MTILLNKKKSQLLLIWLLSGLLSFLLYFFAEKNHDNAIRERTAILTEQAIELVKKHFMVYEYGLLSTRGAILLAGEDNVNKKSFKRYISSLDLTQEFPGARGFGFIRRVLPDQEKSFIEQARQDDSPDFKIKTLTTHNKDRFIVQYIFPQINNNDSVGLDIGSESNRRAAAINAAFTGKATLSAPITLVQDEGKTRRGFLILLPVYSNSVTTGQSGNKLNETIGWSYAPLIVDEVLFDLDSILSEVSITITDKAEKIPFYETKNDSQNSSKLHDISFSREIEFMGRKWMFETQPKQEMLTDMKRYSLKYILFLSFLVASLGSFFILIGAKREDGNSLLNEQYNNKNIHDFLSSQTFSSAIKGILLLILCIMIPSAYFDFEQEIDSTSSILIDHTKYSKGLIDKQQKSYAASLSFIKGGSSVINLINSDTHPDKPTAEFLLWKARLASNFKAYMSSRSDIYQIRLIRADKYGKEILRIEKKGAALISMPEYELQNKGDRDYFINSLKLSNKGLYTSGIGPNYENGIMEKPLRLTRYFSTPIFNSDGTVYGIIVINVDARTLLEEISSLAENDETIYATEENSKLILSNNETDIYRSFTQDKYTWNDIFSRSTNFLKLINKNISLWESKDDSIITSELTVIPNFSDSSGNIKIIASRTVSSIYSNVFSILIRLLFILIGLSIFSLILIYSFWINRKRALISTRMIRELDEQKQKDNMFENLTELSPEAMIICNPDGNIMLINSQAEKLFGYSRTELIGENVSVLIPNVSRQRHDKYVKNHVKSPVTRPMGARKELYSQHANGTKFPVEVSLSPVQLDDRLLIASSVRNISERISIEKTLKQALAEAESASQAKSEFLANMSHEISPPLNAVIGLTYLLKDADLNALQLNLVKKIQLGGHALLNIVNDILDLAKIEANELDVILAPCDLEEMLNEIFSVFSSQAESKNLQLHLELDPELSFYVRTDRKLLQQIITNLLSNAIKFTSKGHVKLSAKKVNGSDSSTSKQVVCFAIEDTGIGIADEMKEQIFHPFNQADQGTNRVYGGTGLGLSIVNNLCHLLGGEIAIESELNKGSRFFCQFPFEILNSDQPLNHLSMPDSLNIWIVGKENKDEPQLEILINSLGWSKLNIASEVDLFSLYSQRAKQMGRVPDLIILDRRLSQICDLSAIEEFTTLADWQNTPLLLVTSEIQYEHIKAHDKNNLIKGCLSQPLSVAQIFNTVNKIISEDTHNRSLVIDSTKINEVQAKWLSAVKILVVDDSQMNLEVVERILTTNGAIVTTADSGALAIEHLKSNMVDFDIILMDVHMPVMDGLQATRHIRKEMNMGKIPIAALTAGTFEEEKNKALAAGMDAFLTKPIEPSRLILCLRKLVESYRDSEIRIETIDAPENTHGDSNWPVIEGISSSANLFQGDLKFFKFTLKRLFEEHSDLALFITTRPMIESTEKRLELANKIHKLKGNAGLIGAKELYALASHAEKELRKTQGIECEEAIVNVAKSYQELHKNAQQFLQENKTEHAQTDNIALTDVQAIDKRELDNLLTALKNNELSALDLISNNSLSLMALLGRENFELFDNYTQRLEFNKALELIKGVQL